MTCLAQGCILGGLNHKWFGVEHSQRGGKCRDEVGSHCVVWAEGVTLSGDQGTRNDSEGGNARDLWLKNQQGSTRERSPKGQPLLPMAVSSILCLPWHLNPISFLSQLITSHPASFAPQNVSDVHSFLFFKSVSSPFSSKANPSPGVLDPWLPLPYGIPSKYFLPYIPWLFPAHKHA